MNRPDVGVEKSASVPPATRDSVARAWLAAQTEREVIFRETGVRINEQGLVVRGAV